LPLDNCTIFWYNGIKKVKEEPKMSGWVVKNQRAKQDQISRARERQGREGGTVTRHGNYYSREEWDEMQAEQARDAAEGDRYLDSIEDVLGEAAKRLEALGVENGYSVAHRLYNYGTEGISFTSEEKRLAVEAISDWIAEQDRKLW
jgi:hypothetical protein